MSTIAKPIRAQSAGKPVDLNPLIGRLLAGCEDPARLLDDVLAAMCRLGQVESGAMIDPGDLLGRGVEHSPGVPIRAVYPKPEHPAPPAWVVDALRLLSSVKPEEGPTVRPLRASSIYGEPPAQHVVFLPMHIGENQWHLGLFLLTTKDQRVVQASLDRLAGCTGLYALFEVQRTSRQTLAGARSLSEAVRVLSAVHEQQRFLAAAMALCNEVQSRWRAQRVSLGLMRGHCVKLAAMSHTEHLKRKTALAQAIESAMEECVDQEIEVTWPPLPDQMVVAREAEALAKAHGPCCVVSVPLWVGGDAVGVLMVERAVDRPTNAVEAEALRLTCNLVAPPLIQLKENDRWLPAKAITSVERTAAKLIGPQHTWVKLAAVAVCAVLALLIFGRGPDRVHSSFLIEAAQRQLMIAPFDGYLETAQAEPGDVVETGYVLATLETAELWLRAGQLEADRMRYVKQAGIARREGDIAEQQANDAEAARIQAELDLVHYQIEHATITSSLPGAGVVLEGDHKRRIGGVVQKGDVLFEIAPLEGLEAQLYVPEDRISELHVGDRGELASASHPGSFIPFTIERIEPAAMVKDEQNVFRVHARLEETPPWLRTGMEGVAKIKVGQASYLWLWTRDAVNWVRMKLWM